MDPLVQSLRRTDPPPEAQGVVLGGDPAVPRALLHHPPEQVPLEGDSRGAAHGLGQLAIRAEGILRLTAVAVLDPHDSPGRVDVLREEVVRAEHLHHAPGLVVGELPPQPIEAALGGHLSGGTQLEPVHVSVLVADSGEVLLRVPDERDGGARLGPRREPPHALVRGADVLLAVAGADDVALGIVEELVTFPLASQSRAMRPSASYSRRSVFPFPSMSATHRPSRSYTLRVSFPSGVRTIHDVALAS